MSFLSKLFGNIPLNNKSTFIVVIATTGVTLATVYYYYFYHVRKRVGRGEKDEIKIVGRCKDLKGKGNALFKEGKFEEALKVYTEGIELLVEGEGGDQEGEEEVKEALGQLYQNRAAVYEKLSHHPLVISNTTLALSLNPRYTKALHRRAKSYRATGFLPESLYDITQVCILENFSNPNSVNLADEILKEIGVSEAKSIIESRKKVIPPGIGTVRAYLRGWWNCPVSRGIREGKEEGESSYSKAMKAVRDNDFDHVVDLCSEGINKGEFVLEARYLRGVFRFLYGSPEEDILADLYYVVQNGDGRREYKASALIKIACQYALEGEGGKGWENCEEAFKEAEVVWGDNVDLYSQWGQVLLTRSLLPEALTYLTKASSLINTDAFPLPYATQLYIQYRVEGASDDIPAADMTVKDFEKLVRKCGEDTKWPDLWALWGQILLENGRISEADTAFSRVLSMDKYNSSVVVHRAMAKAQQGGERGLNEAIGMLKDVCDNVDDKNEFVWETLGTLYLQSPDLPSAISAFSHAISLTRSQQELTMLCSLKKAAEVQMKVKQDTGLTVDKGMFVK